MRALLFLYFLAAGITWVSGEAGKGIAGRVAIADLLLLLIIALVVLVHPGWLRASRLVRAALLMFLAFSLGIVNSANVRGSMVEWLIHGFLVVGFIVIYSLIVRLPIDERLEIAGLWVRAATCLAVFGLYEFVGSGLLGLPSILAAIGQTPFTMGGLVATFRNTGQAGVFFAMALATAIPLQRVLRGRRRTEMLFSIVVLGLSVMFTVKRSAMLAVGIGVVLLFVMDPSIKGRMRSVAMAAIAAAVVLPASLWMLERSAAFRNRVDYKLAGGQGVDVAERFARDNFVAAEAAFTSHPFTGAGLGGITGVYTATFEIHSTYLGIPAQTGLIGTLAYLWFMFVFFQACTRTRNDDPRTWLMGRLYMPLLLGLTVSFGYTYHLRKREFWITAAIASALMAPEALRGQAAERRGAVVPVRQRPGRPVPPAPVPL